MNLNKITSSFWGFAPSVLFFVFVVSEGFVPFVVITLYDTPIHNWSFYRHMFI